MDEVPVPVRVQVQGMTAIQDRAVVTDQIQNATLTLNRCAPKWRRERAVNGEVVTMQIVLRHLLNRDVVIQRLEIRNATSTMKRPAPKWQNERDANGYRVTMPIVQLLHHLLNRDVAADQIQNVTPTMRRRAIDSQREKAVVGHRWRCGYVICH